MHALSGRTIVFLPGLDGTGISFAPLASQLPQDVRVRVIRYPAHRQLDFEETVQCAKIQMPANLKHAVMIAESFSGPVAIALIGSGQIAPACLILCATFARYPRPLLLKALRFVPLEPLLRLPWPPAILKHVVEGGQENADLLLAMWQKVKRLVPARTLVHRLEVIRRLDVRHWLPRLNLPCLYIQATGDRTVPAACLADFTQTVPDLKVVRIQGPHFILQARPQAALKAIQNFVADVQGSLSDRGTPPRAPCRV